MQFSLKWLLKGCGMQCKWMESIWDSRFTPSQGTCSAPWVPARQWLQALYYFSTSTVSLLALSWEVCGKSSRPDHLLTQTSMGMAAHTQNLSPGRSIRNSAHSTVHCFFVLQPASCPGGATTLPTEGPSFPLSLNLNFCLHRLPRRLAEHPGGSVPVIIPDPLYNFAKGRRVYN